METASCITIGDVNMDLYTDLSDIDPVPGFMADACYFKSIRNDIGGNGVFFAEAAVEAGFQNAYLVSCLGIGEDGQPDVSAKMVLERYRNTRVIPVFSYSKRSQTGQVIIIYQQDDKRLLIANRGANEALTGKNFPNLTWIAKKCKLAYVSGYMLINEKQRQSVTKRVKYFEQQGCRSFLDVVPHDLFNIIKLSEFKKWLHSFSGFAIELTTLLNFTGSASRAEATYRLRREILLNNQFALIRLNNKSDFIICSQNNEREIYIPYIDRFASLRFTDRVIAHMLHSYAISGYSLFDRLDWVEVLTEKLKQAQ